MISIDPVNGPEVLDGLEVDPNGQFRNSRWIGEGSKRLGFEGSVPVGEFRSILSDPFLPKPCGYRVRGLAPNPLDQARAKAPQLERLQMTEAHDSAMIACVRH